MNSKGGKASFGKAGSREGEFFNKKKKSRFSWEVQGGVEKGCQYSSGGERGERTKSILRRRSLSKDWDSKEMSRASLRGKEKKVPT